MKFIGIFLIISGILLCVCLIILAVLVIEGIIIDIKFKKMIDKLNNIKFKKMTDKSPLLKKLIKDGLYKK